MSKEKIVRTAQRFLRRTEAYKDKCDSGNSAAENFQLHYVYVKGEFSAPEDMIACAFYGDEVLVFYPLEKDTSGYVDVMTDMEEAVFGELENGYEIAEMSMDCHYNIWCMIEERCEDGIERKEGLQKYLEYCRREKITKEKIDADGPFPVSDAMKLYQKSSREMDRKYER